MAVEKSAVREGTRWDLCGRIVLVAEVTDKSVIYSDEHGFKDEVMKLDGFLARASDPQRAEHSRLIHGLSFTSTGLPGDDPTGKLLALVRDAAVYLLERMPPTCPRYVEPAPPAPKAEPLPASTIAALSEAYAVPGDICVVAEPEPLEDYAIAMPVDEPPSVKKRRAGWAA